MRKFSTFAIALFVSLAAGAQTSFNLNAKDTAYIETVDGNLVINVAKTASKIEFPVLSIENPFKGKDFTEAEISFDVRNYDAFHVLGALFSFYDSGLGRLYFTNGSYLGYNATGGWFDANLLNYKADSSFLNNTWKNIKLQFTTTGYALYVNNKQAYNQSSKNVHIEGDLTDYTNIINFLKNASTFAVGAGSFWSDNTQSDGTFYDYQYSYIKNLRFTPNFSTRPAN